MKSKKLKDILEALLKKDSRLVDENKELNLAAIRDLADKTDSKLIELLLSNDEATKKFFLKVKNVLVFKQNDFKFFLDSNQIDNTYTAYENRIGLASGNRLLKDNDNVVLNFPFKDCVLEGGQSTEEGMDEYFKYNEEDRKYEKHEAERKEIFFNEILAQDEIDRLYEPKAFTNIKKYTAKGEEKIKEFARDKDGIITDNLIIKGNNLLALHSLKEEFTGQIKLIYIDPPYNTGNDSFKYNDKFNHSAWLTFMKNRLELAKELLKEDGFIFISIDDREHAYLKILCDEIFTRNNFVSDIIIQVNKGGRDYLKIAKTHEFIVCYQMSDNAEINEVEKTSLVFKYSDTASNYNIRELRNRNPKFNRENRPNLYYEFYVDKESIDDDGFCLVSLEKKGKFKIGIFPKNSLNEESCWRWGKEKSLDNIFSSIDKTQIVAKQKSDGNWNIYEKHRKTTGKIKSVWDDSAVRTEAGTKELRKIFNQDAFAFPKPVELIKRIVECATIENDIILDFHAGSGTTAHAVLELNKEGGNRKFIIVEQMDYVKYVTIKRVHHVLKNNKTGSFVYLEIKKWNEGAKEKIAECNSFKELEMLLNELSEKYFLHYNVKFKEFKDKIIHEENFKKLPLKNQQEMFCKMLDLNQLYVNTSEMEDKKYGLSKEDIALTKKFYNI